MRRASLALLTVVAVLAVVAAGCGNDKKPVAETGTTQLPETTTTTEAASTTTAASGVSEDAIVADLSSRLGDLQGYTFTCPTGVAIEAGTILNCQAAPPSAGQESALVFVVVVDADGSYAADFGTGIPSSAAEIAAPGTSCAALLAAGQPYFYAVAYWYAQHMPPGFDDDGNGRPCESAYTAQAVNDFWDSVAPPA